MIEAKHPSELNPLQTYMRAVKMAKTTSRLSNPAWYQDALDLEVQVHCYLKNAGDVQCFLYIKSSNSFEKIEGLSPRQLQMADELKNFVDRVLECESVRKAKALGVVFYLADELSIAGLGPEHQNPGEINNLRNMMIEDPTEVLDDKTVSAETHAWRLFPYSGAPVGQEFATAMAVSRKYDDVLLTLREIGDSRNLPIKTCALSAPLCAIACLPWYTTAKDNGTIGVFNYETFTVVSFYNKRADLMMLRYLHHPPGSSDPVNIGSAVMASATAFELERPEIILLSMVGHDLSNMNISLQSSMVKSDIRLMSIAKVLREMGLPEEISLEMMVATAELDPELYPVAQNATFTSFREDGWHLQDFLAPDQYELDMYPAQEDMNLLKRGRKVKCVAALLCLLVLGYAGFTSWEKTNSRAWTYEPQNTEVTALQLKEEIKRHEHWNSILMDRSKAWSSMELISRLTPADGSVILKDVKHRVDKKLAPKAKKYGLQKSWVVNGYTNDTGLSYLENISTRDGIKEIFKTVADETGSRAYLPNIGQRDITVQMTQRLNPTYNIISSTKASDRFRLVFTMTITQTFTSTDELALTGMKKSKKR